MTLSSRVSEFQIIISRSFSGKICALSFPANLFLVRAMRRSALQIVFLIALFGWFLAVESRRGLDFVEAAYGDWLDANAPRLTPRSSVTLIEINEESLGREKRWPWSPLNYLLFLQAAQQHRFGIAAIEPVLDWSRSPGVSDERLGRFQYEKNLQDAIRRMPKILLGARLGFPDDPDLIPPLEVVPQLRRVTGDTTKLPPFTAIEQEPKEEMRLSATIGFTNVPATPTNVRTIPLLFSYRGQVVPSFALQAAIMWLKLTLDDVQVVVGSQIALGSAVKIPIDAAGSMRVDFRASLARHGSADLLLAAQQAEQKLPPFMPIDDLQNQVVLLTRTDPAARTLALPIAISRPKSKSVDEVASRPPPNPRAGAPGELIAHAIATIQTKSFVRRSGMQVDIFLVLLAMTAGFFALHVPRVQDLALFALLAVLSYLLLAISVFGFWLVALPLVLPAGLAAFIVIFAAISPRETRAA